ASKIFSDCDELPASIFATSDLALPLLLSSSWDRVRIWSADERSWSSSMLGHSMPIRSSTHARASGRTTPMPSPQPVRVEVVVIGRPLRWGLFATPLVVLPARVDRGARHVGHPQPGHAEPGRTLRGRRPHSRTLFQNRGHAVGQGTAGLARRGL